MPLPLSPVAAAIEATAVPWPFGSEVGSVPKADQPVPTLRSPSAEATPVSSTAIFAEPAGAIEPKTFSNPICGSAHCDE